MILWRADRRRHLAGPKAVCRFSCSTSSGVAARISLPCVSPSPARKSLVQDLDDRRTPGLRRLESRERVLRVVETVTPVAANVDPPGLAGEKAEGHVRSGSLHGPKAGVAGG
jgi:hypothetical protein